MLKPDPLVWDGPLPHPLGAALFSWRAIDFGQTSYCIIHDEICDEWAASRKIGNQPAHVFPDLVFSLDDAKRLCERKRFDA